MRKIAIAVLFLSATFTAPASAGSSTPECDLARLVEDTVLSANRTAQLVAIMWTYKSGEALHKNDMERYDTIKRFMTLAIDNKVNSMKLETIASSIVERECDIQ